MSETNKKALIEVRRHQFKSFCKKYGLTNDRLYGGKMQVFPTTKKIMETFGIKSRSVNEYWNGSKLIPEWIIIIILIHDGKIDRYCTMHLDNQ